MATAKVASAPKAKGAVGTMKAAQVPKPGAEFQIVEREIPTPGAGQVRINVLAANAMARRAYEKHGFEPYEVMY